MKLFQCSVFIALGILATTNIADAQEVSPCPRIFTYEPKGPEHDRWYGILTLLDDSDLNGVWVRIIFDRPILQLGNWFGEVVKNGPVDYLIKNSEFMLKAYTPKTVRIFVKYDVQQPPPELVQFRLNAKIVCPEGLTTTTTTTTERLFTSMEEVVRKPLGGVSTNFAATTQSLLDSRSNYGVPGGEHTTEVVVKDAQRPIPGGVTSFGATTRPPLDSRLNYGLTGGDPQSEVVDKNISRPFAGTFTSFAATTPSPLHSGSSYDVTGGERLSEVTDKDIRKPIPGGVTSFGATTSPPLDSRLNYGVTGGENQSEVLPIRAVVQQRPTSENLDEICGTVAEHYRQHRHIGQLAHKGEFPWHAMLYYSKDITIAYLCGAALISKHYLVTVAHCVVKSKSRVPVNPERLIVYLGKYYVKHWQEDSQTCYVADIMPHPEFNSETFDNDIALLKLLDPAKFTDNVRPVCLWKEPPDLNFITNRPGTVVGWGFDEAGKIEDKLMFVHMFVQENEICNRSIANYFDRFASRKTFCANFIDDTVECVGDSGGAIVFPTAITTRGNSVWQLRGLVTVSVVLQRHLKCGRDRYVVFTDVIKYHDWIKENTNLP